VSFLPRHHRHPPSVSSPNRPSRLRGVVGKLPLFDLEADKRLSSLNLKQFALETEKLESSRLADLRDKERRAHSGIIDDSCL